MRLHDKVVQQVLDKTDLPFASVRTYWFKNGQWRVHNGKKVQVKTDKGILISSYIEDGNHTIRISNHPKGSGKYPAPMVNYEYDEKGEIISATNYPKEERK